MSKKYRRVIAAVFNSEWAILPSKLDAICELLELRASGVQLTKDQIQSRVGLIEPPVNQSQGQIAVLNLFGTISQRMNAFSEFSGGTSTEQFTRAFDEAVGDPNVSSIVINVDSPGGSVPGVPELSQRIFEARDSKRIVAVVNPMMASAAYWIGSAASEVVAVPSASDIGSIGVMTLHADRSKAHAKQGTDYTLMRSTEFKAEGNPFGPLSKAAQEHIQARIMGIHGEFVDAVARNRGVSAAVVESSFGRGRTFRAEEAQRLGMVDRVATLETVLNELGVQAGNSGSAAHAPRVHMGDAMMLTAKTKLAVIKAGLCKAGEPDETFQAALQLCGEAKGVDVTALDENATLALFEESQPNVVTTSTLSGPIATTVVTQDAASSGMTMQDLTATVQLCALPAERKLEVVTELAGQLGTLTVSQVLDKINGLETNGNRPAGHVNVAVTEDSHDKFRVGARDAILQRTWGRANNPEQIYDHRNDEMVDFKPDHRQNGMATLPKIAERCLIEAGVPYAKVANLTPMQLAQVVMGKPLDSLGVLASSDGPAYNVSGMFSNILLDASNVLLRRSYTEAPASFAQWMRMGPSVMDFKTVNRVIAGELGDPSAVPEDGEFEESTLTDGKESYKLTVWGEVFSHSWQLVVNDRLGSFTEIPMKLGRAMRRKQNRLAYQALKDNANMADGGALFNATAQTTATGHNNLTTGAVTTVANYVTAFNTMTQNMAEMKGLDTSSGAALNLFPAWIVYPPALRGIVKQTLQSQSSDATNPGLTNIWQGGLSEVSDAELGAATTNGSDTAFYLAANSSDVDTIEYAYLQGLESPVIEQETAFSSLAMRQRIYQAFAVKPLDYRGLQKHTGAA